MDTIEKIKNLQDLLPTIIGARGKNISPEIVSSCSFTYESAEEGAGIFEGKIKKPGYARTGQPTAARYQEIVKIIDGGYNAISTSSGMAAMSMVIMSLLSAGDEMLCVGGVFVGCYTLFKRTLSRFGIKTHFIDTNEIDNIENYINNNTKMIVTESVSNPKMGIADFKALKVVADKYKIIYCIDNTITPIALAPFDYGADLIVYSSTKILVGNASALGGVVITRKITENDKFLDKKYDFLKPFLEKDFANAIMLAFQKRTMRDIGFAPNAFASYLSILGLETLPLRTMQIFNTLPELTKRINEELQLNIRHPSLDFHEDHHLYKKYFPIGCGTLFTIDFDTKKKAFEFLNKLKYIYLTANIGDSRTLAIHPASTMAHDLEDEDKAFLGITDGLIRFSLGLQSVDFVMQEFKKSLS